MKTCQLLILILTDFETNFCYIQFACAFFNFVSKVNLIHFPRLLIYFIFKKKTFKKNSNIHEIVTIILDQKQITQASTIIYVFEEWSVSLNKAYKQQNFFYFQKELSGIMCINFLLLLNNLANAYDAKLFPQVH